MQSHPPWIQVCVNVHQFITVDLLCVHGCLLSSLSLLSATILHIEAKCASYLAHVTDQIIDPSYLIDG